MQNKFRKMNDKAKYHLDQLLMEMHVTSYAEGYEAGKVVTETWSNANPVLSKEEITHEGKFLRKVNRNARVGDVVMFTQDQVRKTHPGTITAGKPYEVIEAWDEPRFLNDSGNKYRVYEKSFGRIPETVYVYEEIRKSLPPNQQRAELIQKAKKFVQERQKTHHHTNFVFVNKGNRITCLIKGNDSGKVLRIDRSNCNPNDVFNLYIGQAISLARALKIDVPVEFLEAIQPTEVVVGHIINVFINGEFGFEHTAFEGDFENGKFYTQEDHTDVIIDDTNAQYEVTT